MTSLRVALDRIAAALRAWRGMADLPAGFYQSPAPPGSAPAEPCFPARIALGFVGEWRLLRFMDKSGAELGVFWLPDKDCVGIATMLMSEPPGDAPGAGLGEGEKRGAKPGLRLVHSSNSPEV